MEAHQAALKYLEILTGQAPSPDNHGEESARTHEEETVISQYSLTSWEIVNR